MTRAQKLWSVLENYPEFDNLKRYIIRLQRINILKLDMANCPFRLWVRKKRYSFWLILNTFLNPSEGSPNIISHTIIYHHGAS